MAMVNPQAYVLLQKIAPFKDTWKVHVKVLHSWKANTSFGGESLEFVLADETGDKVHASCKRNLMYRLQRNLPVGEWRYIQNFTVSATGGKYRPTASAYKVTFTSETVISKSPRVDDNPYLSLAGFDSIGKLNAHYLIDVIGEVVDTGGIQNVQAQQKDTKKIQFHLRDVNGHVLACCLWGKYAEEFQSQFEATEDETKLCLMRFAKISSYRGEVQVTNAFDSSVVTLNPEIKEADLFKEKLLQNEQSLTLIDNKDDRMVLKQPHQDWNAVEIRSIAEILDSVEVQNCKIICSIESIEVNWGWFYFSCVPCNKCVTRIGRNDPTLVKPKWRCEKCHSNVTKVEPKFKLHLLVQDDSDSCKLMLLDTVAKVIIGNSAVELWDGSYDEIEDPEDIPMPIRSLEGKSYCFGLSITSDNVDNGSDTYKVSEVWTGDNQHGVESNSAPVSELETNSSTFSSGEVMLITYNSDQCGEGFSTPTVKRKDGDSDVNDITSTSKKHCSKTIKLEKTKCD